MRFRFLDKNYSAKDYRLLKQNTIELVKGAVEKTAYNANFLSEHHLEVGSNPHRYDKIYLYYKDDVAEAIDGIKNDFKQAVVDFVYDGFPKMFKKDPDTPSEVRLVPKEEERKEAMMKVSKGFNEKQVYISLIPIKEELIEWKFGEKSPKLSVESLKNHPGKLTAKFLPTSEFGVYYNGQQIQSEDPNSPSGKTGFQKTRYKKGTNPGAMTQGQNAYLRSGENPETALLNAVKVINNHRGGLEYEIKYEIDHKTYPTGIRFKMMPSYNSPAMFVYADSTGMVHNYPKANRTGRIPRIGKDLLDKYGSQFYQVDHDAFDRAIELMVKTDRSRNETQLENTTFMRSDLGVKEEIFADWLNTTIDKEINHKVEFYKLGNNSKEQPDNSKEQSNTELKF